jgi:hypothetical protein
VIGQERLRPDDVQRDITLFMIQQESQVPHGQIILGLLSKTLEHVNERYRRRIEYVKSLIAAELMQQGEYEVSAVYTAYHDAAEAYRYSRRTRI